MSDKPTYEEQMKVLKEGLEIANALRTRAQTSKEMLEEQLAKIEEEIRALGVEPENLRSEIERLKNEMEQLLHEAYQMIPWDLVKKHGK